MAPWTTGTGSARRCMNAEDPMSNYWAYCDPCGRWFYPDGEQGGTTPPCPVCSTEAATLAEQPQGLTAGPSLT